MSLVMSRRANRTAVFVVTALALAVIGSLGPGRVVTTRAAGADHMEIAQAPDVGSACTSGTYTGGVAWSSSCQPVVYQVSNVTSTIDTTDSTSTVTLAAVAVTGAPGGTLTCTGGDTKTFASGQAHFAGCSIDKAGQYFLKATVGNNPLEMPASTNSSTGGFAIAVGPAAKLILTGLGSNKAGTSQSPTVTVEDAGGNVVTTFAHTVSFNSTDAAATLPAPYMFIAADHGAHTFTNGVVLKTAGAAPGTSKDQTVNATDTPDGLTPGSQTVTVTDGDVSSFGISPQNATTPSGDNVQYSADTFDAYGNPVADVTAGTTFTSSTGGSCSGSPGATPTCGSTTAGTYTITGANTTYAGKGSPATTSLIVVANPTRHFIFSNSPFDNAVSNGGFETDSFGSDWTTATPNCSVSCPTPTVSTTHTHSGAFAAHMGTAMSSAPAEPSGGSTISQTFTVPSAASLSFWYWPATTDGANCNLQSPPDYQSATITDNTDSTKNATVFKVCSNSQTWTHQTVDLSTFAGHSITLTFNVTQDGLTTPTEMYLDDVAVSTAAAPGWTGGQVFTTQPQVTELDSNNNLVNDSSSQVQLVLVGGTAGATLACGPVTLSGGIGTFSGCAIDRAGSDYMLEATKASTGGNAIAPSWSNDINITVGPADKLVLTGLADGAAGTQQTPTVTVEDAGTDVIAGFTGTVTFASTDSQATVPAGYTFTGGDAGTHTFTNGVVLKTAGAQSVTVSSATVPNAGGQTVNVTPGAFTGISLTPNPWTITAGQSRAYTVQKQDAYGNTIADVTSTSTFGITPDGTCTTNSCSATTAGDHTVSATYTESATDYHANAILHVNPAATASLALSPASAGVAQSQAQGFSASGFDQYGNSTGDQTAHTTFGISPTSATTPAACTGTSCMARYAGLYTVTGTEGAASGTASLTVNPGGYSLNAYGALRSYGTVSPNSSLGPIWPGWKIARDTASCPDLALADSGVILDGFGGVHPYGVVSVGAGASYWSGWDIARKVVLSSCAANVASGYVMDAWGGLHPFGTAPAATGNAYWSGWDIARGITLIPGTTSGYTMDGFGGIHPFNGAPDVPFGTYAYWGGWDIARGIVAIAPGQGYTLDGWGGIHPFGGATPTTGYSYWAGWDIARGIIWEPNLNNGNGAGYTLDGWGGVHPFNGAPSVSSSGYYPGQDVVRGISG